MYARHCQQYRRYAYLYMFCKSPYFMHIICYNCALNRIAALLVLEGQIYNYQLNRSHVCKSLMLFHSCDLIVHVNCALNRSQLILPIQDYKDCASHYVLFMMSFVPLFFFYFSWQGHKDIVQVSQVLFHSCQCCDFNLIYTSRNTL